MTDKKLSFKRTEIEMPDGRKLYNYEFEPQEGLSESQDSQVSSSDANPAKESPPE